jgi:hypothetical protein
VSNPLSIADAGGREHAIRREMLATAALTIRNLASEELPADPDPGTVAGYVVNDLSLLVARWADDRAPGPS